MSLLNCHPAGFSRWGLGVRSSGAKTPETTLCVRGRRGGWGECLEESRRSWWEGGRRWGGRRRDEDLKASNTEGATCQNHSKIKWSYRMSVSVDFLFSDCSLCISLKAWSDRRERETSRKIRFWILCSRNLFPILLARFANPQVWLLLPQERCLHSCNDTHKIIFQTLFLPPFSLQVSLDKVLT